MKGSNSNLFRLRDPEVSYNRIVNTNAKRLCVFAGPGTGKTYALRKRVARLLGDGILPSEILVTTFTRTAANDLRQALNLENISGATQVKAGTLHAHCLKILHRNNVLQVTGRVPRQLMEYEKRFLLEDLRFIGKEDLDTIQERFSAFAAAWARDQRDKPGWPKDLDDQEFERQMLQWLVFHQAMVIEEVVPETLRYLRNNPASYEKSEFTDVLVDEYQDLNVSEQKVIDLIAESAQLTVIGDEDQSIYSFKHAHPEGIAKFKERHPKTVDESLFLCRRCPSNLVELANSVIRQNLNRAERCLVSHTESEQAFVRVVQWQGMKKEAKGIAEFTKGITYESATNPLTARR